MVYNRVFAVRSWGSCENAYGASQIRKTLYTIALKIGD